MFGFRSSVPSGTHRSLIAAENALADQSQKHPDGWGIGWFVDDEAYVIKSSNAAHACARFERASHRLTSHTFVVHVRRATVGLVDHVNAHPFRFGRWLFAHNGTIFAFDELREWFEEQIDPRFLPLILGDTDSEHLFFFLLTRLEAAGVDRTGRAAADCARIGEIVRAGVLEIDRLARSRGILRPILNVLLTDGRTMIGHKAGMPLFLSTQKRFCADLETCTAPNKSCMEADRPDGPVNHLLIASEKIAVDQNIWEELEDGTTLTLDLNFLLTLNPPPRDWIAPVLPEHLRVQSELPAP